MNEKKNDNLITPEWVIKPLGVFDLDPCAGIDTWHAIWNTRMKTDGGGLTQDWSGLVWCNPPFSQKELWIEKFIKHGNGILLLPERGSAPWFGPLAKACGCYFVMGKKINFIGGSSSNNVGSVLFPMGKIAIERIKNSGLPGHFVNVEYFNPR